MKLILSLVVSLTIGFIMYLYIFKPPIELLSPLSTSPHTRYSIQNTSYIVLGFAPYWNMKKISPESIATISHLAYFNLHLNGNGQIYTKVNAREEDPGFTNYKRLVAGIYSHLNRPIILTFMPESQSALSTMISTPTLRAKTIETIIEKVKESDAIGVNIDFEPLGDIPLSTRNNFTLFIKELRPRLDALNGLDGLDKLLTISTYASAAVRPRIWDLAALNGYTNYFVIMTYDYTMPNSLSAGPNSPLRGSGQLFEHDIVKNISEITKLVNPSKLLLGIPFYGYEWDTKDASKYSPTETKGSMASFERIQKLLENQTLELLWDRNSLTPYGVSSTSGQISQIYFENETSIKLKIDFVKSAGLGGVAIWALGYEGNNSWVWPIIRQLNN